MNRYASDELDWVAVRSECSGSKAFSALRSRAEANVAKRNDLRTTDETQRRVKFVFHTRPAIADS
jgi:hypothetical protein